MRKLFLAMAAVAALLASCSKDDAITGVSKSQVTFTVSAPEMETRAGDYGNGNQATTLYYAVYDAVEGTSHVVGLSNTDGEDFTGGKMEVTLNLVEGRTYDIIFYAQNKEGSPYAVDWANRTLSIADPSTLTANNENYDAFYAHVDALKVGTTAINKTVYLHRPFAQLNILTTKTDLDLGADAGIDISKTAVTVKNIYTKMNLFTDQVDPASETAVTYGAANVLTDDVTANETTYRWLSMNYLLVNAKKMVDVEFTMTDSKVADSKDATLVRNYTTVPVERNHRTNIYGSIITNPAVFNVEIDPEFLDPNHDYDVDNTEVVTTNTLSLQEAIKQAAVDHEENNLPPRTVIFKLTEDGNVSLHANANALTTRADDSANSFATIYIPQIEGLNFVIDGGGITFDGTFDIYGNARYNGEETLTFTNINFKHDDGTIDFISCNTTESDKRYAHNVTIENCTFTGNDNGDVVGMRFRQCYDINVINSTFTKMHSLMWATGTSGITLDGVTVTDSKSGVSFGTSTDVVVKNSNITANTDHGLRADGSVNTNLSIENTSIKANVPVIIRKATAAYNVALKGKNTLTSTGLYDVVFTNGKDDADYVAPTGNWSITGAEGLTVYPLNLAVRNVSELENALNSLNASFSPIIKFVDNITVEKEWDCRNTGAKISVPVEIDGNGHTIKFTNKVYDGGNNMAAFRFENDAKVYGLTFDLTEAKPGFQTNVRAISSKANLEVNDCEFIGNGSANNTRAIIFGEGAGNAISNVEVSITGCKFSNWKRGVSDNENGQDAKVVEIVDNEFNDASVNVSAYNSIVFTENTMNNSGVKITSYTSADTAKVQATNNTLDADVTNEIGTKNHKFTPANVKAQAGFTIFYAE